LVRPRACLATDRPSACYGAISNDDLVE
jgi:hypothetical protein